MQFLIYEYIFIKLVYIYVYVYMIDIICLFRYIYICIFRYIYICDVYEYRVSHHYHLNLCHCHYPQRKLFQECTTWYNYFVVDEHIKLYVIWYIVKCNTFFFPFFQILFANFSHTFSNFLLRNICIQIHSHSLLE